MNKGFTLIESLVAITIIVGAILVGMTLVNRSLAISSIIADRLIAANLAQEGIEIARNIRDDNWIQYEAWNDGLTTGDWQADYTSDSLSGYTGEPLLFDSATGRYSYQSGSPSRFTRRISIEQISEYEIRVTSYISWSGKGDIDFDTEVEDHLYAYY